MLSTATMSVRTEQLIMQWPHRVRLIALVLAAPGLISACQGGETLTIPPDPPAQADDGRVANVAYNAPIEAARTRLVAMRASRHYPAVSVAIAVGRDMVWADAWGWASIEKRIAVTTGSRFPVASVSKPMTAAVAMRLVERGVLDLDHDVREYVPDFPKKAFPVTSRQLLSHQAGIRHYRRIRTKPWLSELYLNRDFPELRSALSLFADDRLEFEPDAGFLYSSFGYTLLGAAMEGATGRKFLDLLNDELLAPNRMSATGPDSSDAISGRTSDYVAAKAPGTVRTARLTNSSYKWPGGGLLSTATDLVRFGQAMLADEVVSSSSRNAMFTPRLLRNGEENPMRYGLGWRIATVRYLTDSTRQLTAVYHGGSAVGAESALVLIPAAGVAVAITGNAATGGDSAMVDVAIDIARSFVAQQEREASSRQAALTGGISRRLSPRPQRTYSLQPTHGHADCTDFGRASALHSAIRGARGTGHLCRLPCPAPVRVQPAAGALERRVRLGAVRADGSRRSD